MTAATERSIRVDDRWSGAHGIGRYATEVLARLSVQWESMGLDGSTAGPFELLRRLPIERDDIVYSPGYTTFLGARRQFVTIHDLIHLRTEGAAGLKYRGYYAVARRLIRRSGLVFTVSDASAQEIAEWLRDDDVQIVNTRGGCSDAFTIEGEAHVEDEPYFLFVGNLRAHKNIETFLAALALVPGRGVVVVPTGERAECMALAAQHGVADRLSLLSGVDDAELARLYRGAVALVFPSLLEGFGLPALESVRCGTPVLYWAGCPSVAEIVGDDGAAVGSARDAEAWADLMNAELAMARRAAHSGSEIFRWERVAGIVDAVLRERS